MSINRFEFSFEFIIKTIEILVEIIGIESEQFIERVRRYAHLNILIH